MPKGPMRILLADDQKEIRLLTANQLERGGHHVVAVADGAKALEALRHEKFDVILMDEQMPRMNGIEALHAIREREQEFGRAVVIALTGYNTDPDRERLMGVGFDGVIGKPFRMSSLQELLLRPAESIASSAAAQPPESGKQDSEPDLLQRVGGDAKLLRKMIGTFQRDTPKRMAEIQKAIRQENSEKLASVAHALKGSVSIFSAEKARQHCQQLQELGRNGQVSGAAEIYDLLKEEIAELEANLRVYAGQKSGLRSGAALRQNRRASGSKRKLGS
jgi:two-component system, sensor histidine kinase and response regulator